MNITNEHRKNTASKFIIKLFILILVVVLIVNNESVVGEENTSAVSVPKFKAAGIYIVKKGENFHEKITTTEKDSIIFYNKNKADQPATEGKIYTKPIPITTNTTVIKAINTKIGFSDSYEVVRFYSHTSMGIPPRYKGIKVSKKKIKRGKKMIKGTLRFNSEVTVYIKFKVKPKKGKIKKYYAKVKSGKWKIKLKKRLKKGDRVTISAYTKDYIVRLTKDNKADNTMNVAVEWIPNDTWIPIKKKL